VSERLTYRRQPALTDGRGTVICCVARRVDSQCDIATVETMRVHLHICTGHPRRGHAQRPRQLPDMRRRAREFPPIDDMRVCGGRYALELPQPHTSAVPTERRRPPAPLNGSAASARGCGIRFDTCVNMRALIDSVRCLSHARMRPPSSHPLKTLIDLSGRAHEHREADDDRGTTVRLSSGLTPRPESYPPASSATCLRRTDGVGPGVGEQRASVRKPT
jgi:hypothetical protein